MKRPGGKADATGNQVSALRGLSKYLGELAVGAVEAGTAVEVWAETYETARDKGPGGAVPLVLAMADAQAKLGKVTKILAEFNTPGSRIARAVEAISGEAVR